MPRQPKPKFVDLEEEHPFCPRWGKNARNPLEGFEDSPSPLREDALDQLADLLKIGRDPEKKMRLAEMVEGVLFNYYEGVDTALDRLPSRLQTQSNLEILGASAGVLLEVLCELPGRVEDAAIQNTYADTRSRWGGDSYAPEGWPELFLRLSVGLRLLQRAAEDARTWPGLEALPSRRRPPRAALASTVRSLCEVISLLAPADWKRRFDKEYRIDDAREEFVRIALRSAGIQVPGTLRLMKLMPPHKRPKPPKKGV